MVGYRTCPAVPCGHPSSLASWPILIPTKEKQRTIKHIQAKSCPLNTVPLLFLPLPRFNIVVSQTYPLALPFYQQYLITHLLRTNKKTDTNCNTNSISSSINLNSHEAFSPILLEHVLSFLQLEILHPQQSNLCNHNYRSPHTHGVVSTNQPQSYSAMVIVEQPLRTLVI